MVPHGGAREGAGRKAKYDQPTVKVTIRVPESIREFLSTHESMSDAAVTILMRSKSYRSWLKRQK
jgi:hypothetical protein